MPKIPERVMREAQSIYDAMESVEELDRDTARSTVDVKMIANAIIAERERCAVKIISMSDAASRIIAMGWRGNPNMSGDDRDFMGPMQRQRHDNRVSEALGEIAAAILLGD